MRNRLSLSLRLRPLFRRASLDRELDDELRFHLEQQIEQNLAAGMSPEDARYAALRDFGGLAQQKDACRDARGAGALERLLDDLRHALRALRRDPMLALAATLTLAVSIGANTTVFSVVNSVLIRPLSFPDSSRIVWLGERLGREQSEIGIGADYYSLRELGNAFEEIAAYDTTTVNWGGVEHPEQLDVAQVTPSFFRILGTPPLQGRPLAPGEEGGQAPAVVVLSHAFWRTRMGADPSAVGKTLTLDRLPYQVVGVMPQGFDFPHGTHLWRPLDMDEGAQRPRLPSRPFRMVRMLARVKAGVEERHLETELTRLTRLIRAEYPKEFETAGFLEGMTFFAVPLQRRLTGDLRPALGVLTGAVGLVLLTACANLASLLLARAAARQRELAVRLALGSGRGRIVRQLLAESLVLALPGGLAGTAAAWLAVESLNAWKPLLLERYPALALDLPSLGFSLGLTLLTGLVFGAAPALTAAGVSIHDALKAGSLTQSGARRAARFRQLLVLAELGISLVLLIGAGLLARSFLNLAGTELGFPAEKLLTLKVNLAGSRYATGESQVRFYDEVLERVRQLPLVEAAAVSTDLPLSGEHPYQGAAFQVAGRPPLPPSQRPLANVTVVSRDFFSTLRIPLRGGRIFDSQDSITAADAIVVNEAFARRVFPAEDPLGKRILLGPSGERGWTVAGVVGNIRASHLGAEPEPLIYRCDCQGGNRFLARMAFTVRTAGDPRAAIPAVAGQVYAVDRNQPVFDVKTMEERLSASLAPRRFHLLLIGTFALIAVVLSSLGVYSVMSYLVARRTREIGIRVAMGARPADVLRLVLGESAVLAILAVAAGLGGAWALTRHLTALLHGVAALDARTLVAMPVVLVSLALAASFAPARRASRIDPVSALREE